MNYNEALDYIHGCNKFGVKLGLENIKKLLELLDNPHKKLKFIHVAGTNGKGSTSSYITNILIEEGYDIGLFTSPYLEKFNERIRINNDLIGDERLAEIISKIKTKVEKMVELGYNHPTEFEIITATAFVYYLEENVDLVVLEVGLGGKYDSTNIIDSPIACVITPIDMDHTNILGDTLEKIAYEKAGIIKKNSLVISHYQEKDAKKVIDNVVNEKEGQVYYVNEENFNIKESNEFGSLFDYCFENKIFNDLKIALLGSHQVNNATVAITTIIKLKENDIINVSDDSIINGIYKTKWNGRLEIIDKNPKFIIDGAHNLHGAKALKKALLNNISYNKLILGIGMLGDKDIDNVLKTLIPMADKIIVTEAQVPRALTAEKLGEKIEAFDKEYIIKKDIKEAIEKAYEICKKDDLIVFSGSLYIIGDVRSYITNRK